MYSVVCVARRSRCVCHVEESSTVVSGDDELLLRLVDIISIIFSGGRSAGSQRSVNRDNLYIKNKMIMP